MSNVLKQGKLVDCNGVERWYFDGKLHRENGPAVENANGYRAWYLHDKLIKVVVGAK